MLTITTPTGQPLAHIQTKRTMKIISANLTPHFRNLLREDNPSWEDSQILHWKWTVEGPVFDEVLLDTRDIDSRHPGGESIGRMFAHISAQDSRLTRGARTFILR